MVVLGQSGQVVVVAFVRVVAGPLRGTTTYSSPLVARNGEVSLLSRSVRLRHSSFDEHLTNAIRQAFVGVAAMRE